MGVKEARSQLSDRDCLIGHPLHPPPRSAPVYAFTIAVGETSTTRLCHRLMVYIYIYLLTTLSHQVNRYVNGKWYLTCLVTAFVISKCSRIFIMAITL